MEQPGDQIMTWRHPLPSDLPTGNGHNCILAGDVGGTKTSLALYVREQGPLHPVAEKTVPNAMFSCLEDIIETFLEEQNARPDSACFGVAGPVIDNRVRMTNLAWTVDGRVLQHQFGMQTVTLVNDLVATAMGSVHLPAASLHTLAQGQPDPLGAIAVIAPGTGLGEAFLVRRRNRFFPLPSEGGHCTFAPTDEQQIRLLRYMSLQCTHVSTEQVCSGIGIPNLYDFLCSEGSVRDVLPGIATKEDRTRAIIEAALTALAEGKTAENAAVEALGLFVTILASEAANLVLKVLATGGLYIGGGIPPRILPFLQSETFLPTFCRGMYREMLCTVPVYVVLEPKTALIGAAACGLEQLFQPEACA